MVSSDGLEFPFDTNSFLFLDSPETFSALTECQENPPLLVPENEHNEIVGFVPVSAATNDVYPSSLLENSRIDQETLSRTSRFDQEIVIQNQSFHHEDDHSNHFMPSCTLRNGQRESVYSENYFLASTNKEMTTGLQSIGLQHKPASQSYQQPLLSQTNRNFSKEPYVSTMMGSNVQEMERTNGLTNLNPVYGLQDHRIYPSLFQEEQYDHDFLLEQLKHIYENDQMQQPKSSNMPNPTHMGDLLRNQQQIPYASSSNTISNPEYRTPMISNTHHILKTSGNYSPFAHTSYQSDPFAFNLQSSLKTTRRTRGRPRKYQIPTSPRHYSTQEKGKQPITAMPSLNPTLYNQYQNSYTNTMIQQRIMLPFQEKSVADSSTVSFRQDGNMRSSETNHHEERSIINTMYDPLYAGVGLPIDPHLRFF